MTAVPGRLEEALAGAVRLPGVEVRHVEPEGGRFVVVLVTHFVDDETEPGPREREEETP